MNNDMWIAGNVKFTDSNVYRYLPCGIYYPYEYSSVVQTATIDGKEITTAYDNTGSELRLKVVVNNAWGVEYSYYLTWDPVQEIWHD